MELKDNKTAEILFKVALSLLCSGALAYSKRTHERIDKVEEKLNDVDRRIIVLEHSGCDAAMCNGIRTDLSALQSSVDGLPTEIPPDWFLDKVNTNHAWCSSEISLLKERMSSVERREWQGRGWKYSDEMK